MYQIGTAKVHNLFHKQKSIHKTKQSDGSTTIRKREKMVSDFQHGLVSEFLISLKAGGLDLLADSLLSGSNISHAMTIDDLKFLVGQN